MLARHPSSLFTAEKGSTFGSLSDSKIAGTPFPLNSSSPMVSNGSNSIQGVRHRDGRVSSPPLHSGPVASPTAESSQGIFAEVAPLIASRNSIEHRSPRSSPLPPMAAEVEAAVKFLTHLVKKRLSRMSSPSSPSSTKLNNHTIKSSSSSPISSTVSAKVVSDNSTSASGNRSSPHSGPNHVPSPSIELGSGAVSSGHGLPVIDGLSSSSSVSWPNSGSVVTCESIEHFGLSLTNVLYEYYADHWFPSQPWRGMAYRCLRINGSLDERMTRAAEMSHLDPRVFRAYFPAELTIWVDPGQVSYRIGEDGSVCDLFKGEVILEPPVVDTPPPSVSLHSDDGYGQDYSYHIAVPHCEPAPHNNSHGGTNSLLSRDAVGYTRFCPSPSVFPSQSVAAPDIAWYQWAMNTGMGHHQAQGRSSSPHLAPPAGISPYLGAVTPNGRRGHGQSNSYFVNSDQKMVARDPTEGYGAASLGIGTVHRGTTHYGQVQGLYLATSASSPSFRTTGGSGAISHDNIDALAASMDVLTMDQLFSQDNLNRPMRYGPIPVVEAYGSA